jgi:hypothetical protein
VPNGMAGQNLTFVYDYPGRRTKLYEPTQPVERSSHHPSHPFRLSPQAE